MTEGNYASLLPRRLARATGLVLLDVHAATSLLRYLRRSLSRRGRVGGLEGGRDSIKWDMVRHIVGAARRDRRRHAILFEELTLPKVRLPSPVAMAAFYRANAISRPSAPAIPTPRPGRDAGTSPRAGDR